MKESETKESIDLKIKKLEDLRSKTKFYLSGLKEKQAETYSKIEKSEKNMLELEDVFIKIKDIQIKSADFIVDICKNLLSISFAGFIAISSIDNLNKSVKNGTLVVAIISFLFIVISLFRRFYLTSELKKNYQITFESNLAQQKCLINEIKDIQSEINKISNEMDQNNLEFHKEVAAVHVLIVDSKKVTE